MNTPEGMEEFAQRLSVYRDEVKAVVESSGNLWIQSNDRLEEHGFDVALSSPANSRLVSLSRVKTDRKDAKPPARPHRAGVLSTYFVPGARVEKTNVNQNSLNYIFQDRSYEQLRQCISPSKYSTSCPSVWQWGQSTSVRKSIIGSSIPNFSLIVSRMRDWMDGRFRFSVSAFKATNFSSEKYIITL